MNYCNPLGGNGGGNSGVGVGPEPIAVVDLHRRLPYKWESPLGGQVIGSSQFSELYRDNVGGYTKFTFTFSLYEPSATAGTLTNVPVRFQILTLTARMTRLLFDFTVTAPMDRPIKTIEGAYEQFFINGALFSDLTDAEASHPEIGATRIQLGIYGVP